MNSKKDVAKTLFPDIFSHQPKFNRKDQNMYDYSKAKNALAEYLAGTRKASEIKGFFSPYGI